MKLHFTPFDLIFKYPFRIANNQRTTTPVVYIEIEHEGVIGYGEASMPPYLGETHATANQFLQQAITLIQKFNSPYDIESIVHVVDHIAPGNTAVKAGIDIALHDLVGKLENQPCYKLWNVDPNLTLCTSVTIGMDAPTIIKTKILEATAFNQLKVKLDGTDDLARIQTIRSFTDKPLSVDLNQSWTNREEALEKIQWMHTQNITFVEQPFEKSNLVDAQWLTERSPLPIIADESFQRYTDLSRIQDAFTGINVKLMKCTGLYEANRIIKRAKELNLKILIGCMTESTCAVSAAAQLSPMVDWADLDGPMLIVNDLFEGVQYHEGRLVLRDWSGIGVKKKA